MEILKSPLTLALLASFLFAGTGLSLKAVAGAGPRPDTIIWLGVAVLVMGCVWKFIDGGAISRSLPFIGYSVLCGVFWTLGMICALLAFEVGQVALVAPLYNVNTLWIMLGGFFFFREYEKVSVPYALVGGLLIIIGGTILGFAERR